MTNLKKPGCLYLLTAWYTRKEVGKRTALLYCGSLISGAFSGLIAAGITDGLAGARGIAAWRWLFIIEGALTVMRKDHLHSTSKTNSHIGICGPAIHFHNPGFAENNLLAYRRGKGACRLETGS